MPPKHQEGSPPVLLPSDAHWEFEFSLLTPDSLRLRLQQYRRTTQKSPLDDDRVVPLLKRFGRPRVRDWARDILEDYRTQMGTQTPGTNRPHIDLIVRDLESIAERQHRQRLQRVVNGTGVILHTNLGRAPLADAARQAMAEVAGYSNLELNLDTGTRGHRMDRAETMWCELTGAESALVVNNCAAATLLALCSLAHGREVIISRGQLVEICGSFRLPEVIEQAGARLLEVGTTNKTRIADYELAIGEESAAILRVHQSNFRQVGFQEMASLAELSELSRRRALPLIDDIGSGCIEDLEEFGLSNEPTVAQSLAGGADLVLFSGDKLFGGPQCGMILGRRDLVETCRRSPLSRALRVDKMTLAALEATLQIYLAGRAREEIPTLRAICQPASVLRVRAKRLRSGLKEQVPSARIDVEPMESTVGGGSFPGDVLPSWGIALRTNHATETAGSLRLNDPALVTRIRQGAVHIDLRTISLDEESLVIAALRHVLKDE